MDAERLTVCRSLLAVPDSRLIDRALDALIEQVEAKREIEALEAAPYETDAALAWEAPPGPDLPYDGQIPQDVRRLAARSRRRR